MQDNKKSLNKINNMKKVFETFKETFNRIDEKKVSNVLKTHFEVVIALINYMETEEGISIDEPVKTKNGFIYYDSDGEETEVIIKGKKADIVGGAKNITVDQFANFITGGEPEILLESIVNEKLSRKERQKRKQEELDELLPKAKEIEKEYKKLKAEWQKNKTDHTEARYLAKEEQLRRVAKKIRYVRAEMFENVDEVNEDIKLSKEEIKAAREDYDEFIKMMNKKGFEKKGNLWVKNKFEFILSPEGEYLLSKK